MSALDRRLHAYRPDLADARLEGRVEAARFVAGTPMRIGAPVADMLARPDPSSGVESQLLFGLDVSVFDRGDGFAWVQAADDGYVGYIDQPALATPAADPTHHVVVPRTFVYGEPDMKRPRRVALSMGSRVAVIGEAETRGTRFALLSDGGAIVASHLAPLDVFEDDYVAVAERFATTPYLWGGTSAFGFDCSGLVQLALRMTGRIVLRDTDMQADTIGERIDPGPEMANVRRGDLVFWKGHVAIVDGPDSIVHASGHAMAVTRESLSAAVERIGYLYGRPTCVRRP
ncbi:C40 family peptidase [Nitratireductor mangrovi]|uniref:C40 family peptidase n=1 Tax=Nitratireductor mangrovi TaxID=2599600 RepID=A0A5B8L047_9HYPH|nr:NlpC/P60 family protein [Nitratireductor mangrovi]QDZ01236.1 C40 family peptidase [Nitratireductor mangrovi]